MKIVDEESLISSERLKEFQWNFQKNASYDNIKKQKNKGFNLSPENTLLQKPQWAVKLTSPSLFRVNPATDWIFVITSDLLYTF